MLSMARRRRGLALRPVNSVKNIVDSTNIGVTGATTTSVVLAQTVNDYTGGNADVPIGAKVSSIYVFVQIASDSTNANCDWFFAKRPSGITMPTPGATGGSTARKFILHEEKGLPGTYSAGSTPLTFKGVLKIPRGRQRFAEGDAVVLNLRGAQQYSFCVKAIYKFYQ